MPMFCFVCLFLSVLVLCIYVCGWMRVSVCVVFDNVLFFVLCSYISECALFLIWCMDINLCL